MMNQTCHGFYLGCTQPELYEKAQLIAKRYQFTLNNEEMPRLQLTSEGLMLCVAGFSPLSVDFSSKAWFARHQQGRKRQGLIKACNPAPGMSILDTTAGWGQDAALLASFGAKVVMMERHPVMAALLENSLERLREENPLLSRLSLIYQDSKDYILNLTPQEYPHVIYIDPMHPQRQKSALVKKNMQILQSFISPQNDVKNLIELAIHHCRQRVVVKWPQHSHAVFPTPNSILGKTVRFDIYQSLS